MGLHSNTKISVVIPCYGSQNSIEKVVAEIRDTFKENNHSSYEIILISDDSPDDVYSVIKRIAREDEKISGARLSKNFGQQKASAACALASGKSSGWGWMNTLTWFMLPMKSAPMVFSEASERASTG